MTPQIHRLVWLFALALASSLQFCTANFIESNSQQRRELIQGSTVIGADVSSIPEEDKWPYMIALARCNGTRPTSIVCGATMIHPYVALTAAHCIKSAVGNPTPDPKTFCAIHGNDNITQVLENTSNYTIIPAQDIAVNPNYLQYRRNGEFHITGDVALLFLSEPINQPARPESFIASSTSNPGYVLLPNPRQNWDRQNFSFFGVTIGWGLTENATFEDTLPSSNPQPQRLDDQRITFQVAMSPEECSNSMFFGMKEQPNDTFCGAWFGGFEYMFDRTNGNVTATICRGDSGGPLVIPSTMIDAFTFQGDVQIGIVSAGPECPYAPLGEGIVWPAEYVDVSKYVDWIHQQMRDRGLTPLEVATNPLNRAYRDQTCYPGNCYEQDVMKGVGTNPPKISSGGSPRGVVGAIATVVVAAAVASFF